MSDSELAPFTPGARVRYVGWHPGLFGAEGTIVEVGDHHFPAVRCTFPNAGKHSGAWYVGESLLELLGIPPGPDFNGFGGEW